MGKTLEDLLTKPLPECHYSFLMTRGAGIVTDKHRGEKGWTSPESFERPQKTHFEPISSRHYYFPEKVPMDAS